MNLSQSHCVLCRKGGVALMVSEIEPLLRELSGWHVEDDSKWLVKKYEFKNFAQSLAFVNKVGALAETENHHPDITFGWGYVTLRLQTHAVNGLHSNDFILAAKIDIIQPDA